MSRWLSIVGVGEDGAEGLSPAARALVDTAEVRIGSRRLLEFFENASGEAHPWPSPMGEMAAFVGGFRERRVCVLASGDPMFFGVGATLAAAFPIDEITVVPGPSCVALACARLGWAQAEVEFLSLHGRSFETLHAALVPGARLIVLSADGKTPTRVAGVLAARGFGESTLTVLERLGGPEERVFPFNGKEADPLNVVAVECRADPGAVVWARVPGLPDAAFIGDGTMTKREVRAATLAALAPLPGQLLWDVGAGCGTIAVEWMRAASRCRAVAIERSPERIAFIAGNAASLGVPDLRIVEGTAPEALVGLDAPDAVFIGGGITADGVLDTAWNTLRPGGRLVANVVTLEGERRLFDWHAVHGGDLTRIAVSRAEEVGAMTGWRPLRTVTQYAAVKR